MSADTGTDGTLQLLERKRLQLENQIADFEKQLLHWQSWETDYELFKEELTAAPKADNEQKLPQSVEEFDRKFLTSQEVKKIILDSKGNRRSSSQVLDVLRHRLDYVRGNVDSITKRQDAADEKLRAVDVLIQPDMTDEDGLPLTEITEELDEDDNVISSSVRNTTGDSEALMQKLESEGLAQSEEQQFDGKSQLKPDSAGSAIQEHTNQNVSGQASSQRATAAEALARAKAKQLVDDLKEEGDADDGVDEDAVLSVTRLLGSIGDLDTTSGTELGPGLKMKDASAFKQVTGKRSAQHPNLVEPVIPTDESAEDAALRREMLEYSLGEVGQIVAEMNLDNEDDGDYDDDDEDDEAYGKFNFDDLNEEDEDEDEDEYGRSKRPMISEDYRKQMLELERQLGAKALQNLGPAPGRISPPTSDEEEGPAVATDPVSKPVSKSEASEIAAEPASVPAPALKTKKPGKPKGVRFAEGLDIAEETKPASASSKASADKLEASKKPKVPAVNPLADEIQERKTPARINVAAGASTRKPSRFKATKSAEGPATSAEPTAAKTPPSGPLAGPLLDNLKPIRDERAERFAGPLLSMTAEKPRYTPEGPPGKTLGDVWERDAAAPNPHFLVDEDAGLTRQALAMEYYKERNKRIYQQGGFQAEEPEMIPVDENGEELRPKVSRFKAARLKRTDE